MNKKLSLAILLSGNGTNFQAIVDSIDNGQLKAVIKVVISNNKDAFGLKRACRHLGPCFCMDYLRCIYINLTVLRSSGLSDLCPCL